MSSTTLTDLIKNSWKLNYFRRLLATYLIVCGDYFKPVRNRSLKRDVYKNKKVSIIIPTLSSGSQINHLTTLRDLLAHYLPNQTHRNYEAIVFCDGVNHRVVDMVSSLGDPRISVHSTENTLAKWGHPQTRLGISMAKGDYFVRMNDDNRPYKHYLDTLLSGFDDAVGFVYGRVLYSGDALKAHSISLPKSFVLPNSSHHSLEQRSIDCMNYMVRMDLAKTMCNAWTDDYNADWKFIEAVMQKGFRYVFVDKIIGNKR